MSWYYEINREQRGPVSEEEFADLVNSGVVRAETLVWRAGWPNWRPWGRVAAEGAAGLSDSGSGAAEPLPILFRGDGAEYFRVWIVNVLLTIVTLGIYAAWAKVRTRRYFSANTSLAGHAFEYLADPKRILIGNLIVGGGFLLFNFLGVISPLIQLPFMLAIAVAVPWLIVRSILFNARNTAWRGLRFGFKGRYADALVLFILLPMLLPLTLGLIWPYLVKRRREWLVNEHRYGTSAFRFGGQTDDVYKIYLKALVFFVPLILGYGVMVATMVGSMLSARHSGGPVAPSGALGAMAVMPFLIFGGFVSAFCGAAFVRARIFVYAWNHTSIGAHRFAARMRARDLMALQVVNVLLIVFTLGLAWPWVAVRTARFQLSALRLLPGGDLDGFVADSQPAPGAFSEAASDFLDIDIGFGV